MSKLCDYAETRPAGVPQPAPSTARERFVDQLVRKIESLQRDLHVVEEEVRDMQGRLSRRVPGTVSAFSAGSPNGTGGPGGILSGRLMRRERGMR